MSARILLVAFLLPPTSLVIIGLALLMHSRHGRVLGAGALTMLLALGLPIVSGSLLASLNDSPGIPSAEPQAIVILAGDVIGATSGQPKPGLLTLERLQQGAALHRRTGLPILVTGGPIQEGFITSNVIQSQNFSYADIMTRSLCNDFLVPVHWQEDRSQDTWQNAEYSAAILRMDNIHIVYLVTQAWHMRRALYAFRHFGVNAIAAPVQPDRWPDVEPGGLIPSTRAWQESYYGLHEWVGIIYYRLFR